MKHFIYHFLLQINFGIFGKALDWLKSYLSGRSQQILTNSTLSGQFLFTCGVPQGSCLGPVIHTVKTRI